MQGQCKDCLFWDASKLLSEDSVRRHLAARCLHKKVALDGHDNVDGLGVHDLENYVPPERAIYTGPHFGCIHFEKEPCDDQS